MSGTERKVDAESLRQLGFAEDLIEEALGHQERGVLAFEPPADLVRRTIEKSAHLFQEEAGKAQPATDPSWGLYSEVMGIGRLTPDPGQFAAVAGSLSNQYSRSLGYAFSAHDRPMVMLDNHNLIQPGWWQQDPIFRCMRDAAGTVNRTAREHGLAPSVLLVVLRPQVSDYGKAELQSIASLVEEASSDIWWMPYDANDPYAGQDVVAVGEESVLKIDVMADTPLEAIEAMKTTTDPTLVKQVRSDLLAYMDRATPVKVNGTLSGPLAQTGVTPDSVRNAIGMVISEGAAPSAAA
jgi:hypothetical protein